MAGDISRNSRLSGEDLNFWWLDSPMQPTTMAMLMVLDRAPDPKRVRLAFDRAFDAVPRLTQRVAEAPLDITLPHWEDDPTFDPDYLTKVMPGIDVRRDILEATPMKIVLPPGKVPVVSKSVVTGIGFRLPRGLLRDEGPIPLTPFPRREGGTLHATPSG